jgi:chromosome segregation ATPase
MRSSVAVILRMTIVHRLVASSSSSSISANNNNEPDGIRRALESVMRQNEEMERRLRELSQQNSEYVSRLSSLETQVGQQQQRRQLPVQQQQQQQQAQLAVMPSSGTSASGGGTDDYGGDDGTTGPTTSTNSAAAITTTIGESTTYAQAQANAASIRGLEKKLSDFRKKIRQRVRTNRDACNQVKAQTTQSATTINRIDKKVGKLQSSVDASVNDIQVLNGVVDAQTLKLQQLNKDGYQSASTSNDSGGGSGSQASLASLNEGLARIEALEAQVEFLTKKSERQQKKIKDQEDAMNQLVITSVGTVDPAVAVAMGNFAASLNETQNDLQEWSGRVEDVENKLDLMLESLLNMNNGTATSNSTNGTVANLSYEEKLAILSSVVKSNSQRIEALENSSDVSDLELAVAALADWANGTTADVSELYDMVTELAEEANATTTVTTPPTTNITADSNTTTTNSSTTTTTNSSSTTTNSSTTNSSIVAPGANETYTPASVDVATLPPVIDANASTGGEPGLDVEATLEDVLARLSALESLVDYDGDDDTNATVNVTDIASNGTAETNSTGNATTTNSTAMSIGSLVSWMRSEILSLTQKVQGQGAQLAKTDSDVSTLFDTLFYEAPVPAPNSTSNETTATNGTNLTAGAPLVSRLDQLELAVKNLEGGGFLVVESPPSEPSDNVTIDANATLPLPEPMPVNVTIDANATLPLPEPMPVNVTGPVNVTSDFDLLLSRIEALESEVFVENSTDSRLDVLEVAYTELELGIGAAANATAGSADLTNLTQKVDALTGMNATQLEELLGRLEDSEAMIEDLAGMLDDANASFAAVALLVNATAEHAADIDTILATLDNLTAAATSLDERLDVQEDELANYQESTDGALMTLQASFRSINATSDDGKLEEVLQALNTTSTTVAGLNATVSDQGKKIKSTMRQIEDLASQLDVVSSLEDQLGNLTATVTEEISLVNEGLDLVEELAQGTAESLANLTRKLDQQGSGARR